MVCYTPVFEPLLILSFSNKILRNATPKSLVILDGKEPDLTKPLQVLTQVE